MRGSQSQDLLGCRSKLVAMSRHGAGAPSVYSVRSGRFQPLYLDPFGIHLCQVVLRLLNKPALGTAAEAFG